MVEMLRLRDLILKRRGFSFIEHIGEPPSAFRSGGWAEFPGVMVATSDALVETLMDTQKIPALSVAVAKAGTIVFSKGFGYADPQRHTKVTADSLFRIASNSKAITAAAIHVLVERRMLSLSDRVFGAGAILGDTYGTKPYSNWLVQIEVRHLLEHTAGGWGSESNDPMFKSAGLSHSALITATLDADLLKRPPGVEFIYSNFGYCLLGRIIERKTDMSYEDFVRRSVLIPAGANAMQIGFDTLAQRVPQEVVYRSTGGGSPYGLPVRRMDSHGGWIASAADYVRFLLAVDGSAMPPDVLAAAEVKSIRTPSDASVLPPPVPPPPPPVPRVGYGHGVGTDEVDVWHNGALLGSRAVMWGGTNGHAWCVLCTGGASPEGKTKKKGDPLLQAMNDMMWELWKVV